MAAGNDPVFSFKPQTTLGLQLETTSLQIWEIVLRDPTTTLTDVLLALEGWVLFRRLRRGGSGSLSPEASGKPPTDPLGPSASWTYFFLFFSVATLLGAVKHGLPHYLTGFPFSLVVFGSSLAAGIGVLFAEMAAAQTYVRTSRARAWTRRAAKGKFVLFLLFISLSSSFLVVIVNAALGFVPIMVADYAGFRHGYRGTGWIGGGLTVSSLAAAFYLLGFPNHPWFEYRDLGHLLMMVTVFMIYEGARKPAAFPDPLGGGIQSRNTTARTP